jgi:uncharacterized membrane protein (DUF2068 family)
VDWDRRTCARRGHITYAPTEPELRERLRVSTAAGEAWRCLRCGDFAVGEPHGSGSSGDAPLVLRGRALRDVFVLRLLALERGIRGVLIVLAGVAVIEFRNSEHALRQLFERDLTALKPAADNFNYDLENSPIVATIRHTFAFKQSTLLVVAIALFAYALIELVEGVGLWLAKRWAEYFTVVATALFLPLEIRELTERITWLRVGALAVNVAAIVYLILAKRLFGARGGGAAAERERRGASLLEVEHAAALKASDSAGPAVVRPGRPPGE